MFFVSLIKQDSHHFFCKMSLEPPCCKCQKKSQPRNIYDSGGNSCSFRNNLVSFITFISPLFPKPVSWLGLFCCFLQQESSNTLQHYNHQRICLIDPCNHPSVQLCHVIQLNEGQFKGVNCNIQFFKHIIMTNLI